MLNQIQILSRVLDPHHFKADPDPAYHFNAAHHASNLSLESSSVTDPHIKFNAEQDPDFYSGFRIRITLMQIRFRIQLFTLMRIRIPLLTLMRIRIQFLKTMLIHANPDPKPYFLSLADKRPGSNMAPDLGSAIPKKVKFLCSGGPYYVLYTALLIS
jgi:hypothetical protein